MRLLLARRRMSEMPTGLTNAILWLTVGLWACASSDGGRPGAEADSRYVSCEPDSGCPEPQSLWIEPITHEVDAGEDSKSVSAYSDVWIDAPCRGDACPATSPDGAWRMQTTCLAGVVASGGKFALCLAGGKVTSLRFLGRTWIPCSPDRDTVELDVNAGFVTFELHDLHADNCDGASGGSLRGGVSIRFVSSQCGAFDYFGCGPGDL